MIHQANLSVESLWQKDLKQSFTRPEDLLQFLALPVEQFANDIKARKLFNMRVPRHFARLMEKGNASDPLLLQVLPLAQEFLEQVGYVQDPLEEQNNQLPGLLHKYKSRVLLMFRTGCAVNCRYCFRRHFPYGDNSVNKSKLLDALAYIQSDSKINEVILSGGDPLMADDEALSWFITECEKISHIKRLRIHTRLPVVIPSRVTNELCDLLQNSRLKTILVFHINHANELSPELNQACEKLKQANVLLLNQAVLLKGVNDSVEQQVKLAEALFDMDIQPYYLHLLDKVKGAGHFDLAEDTAKKIYQGMLTNLPGFLVPKLVREIGGETSKTPVLP